MNSLLIILLSSMLIQSSAIAMGKLEEEVVARGVLREEFRTATFTLLTMTLASLAAYSLKLALGHWDLAYLRTPILLIVLSILFVAAKKLMPATAHQMRWQNFITYLTNHGSMLGMALYSYYYIESSLEALGYGLGAAITLAILSPCFYSLRQRVNMANVPLAFRGIPITLVTAGFMALALLGFTGMVRN